MQEERGEIAVDEEGAMEVASPSAAVATTTARAVSPPVSPPESSGVAAATFPLRHEFRYREDTFTVVSAPYQKNGRFGYDLEHTRGTHWFREDVLVDLDRYDELTSEGKAAVDKEREGKGFAAALMYRLRSSAPEPLTASAAKRTRRANGEVQPLQVEKHDP